MTQRNPTQRLNCFQRNPLLSPQGFQKIALYKPRNMTNNPPMNLPSFGLSSEDSKEHFFQVIEHRFDNLLNNNSTDEESQVY